MTLKIINPSNEYFNVSTIVATMKINDLSQAPSIGDKIAVMNPDQKVRLCSVKDRVLTYDNMGISEVELYIEFNLKWTGHFSNLVDAVSNLSYDDALSVIHKFVEKEDISVFDIDVAMSTMPPSNVLGFLTEVRKWLVESK